MQETDLRIYRDQLEEQSGGKINETFVQILVAQRTHHWMKLTHILANALSCSSNVCH